MEKQSHCWNLIYVTVWQKTAGSHQARPLELIAAVLDDDALQRCSWSVPEVALRREHYSIVYFLTDATASCVKQHRSSWHAAKKETV